MIYKIISSSDFLDDETTATTPEITRRIAGYRESTPGVVELDKDLFFQKILLQLKLKGSIEREIIQSFCQLKETLEAEGVELLLKDIFFISLIKVLSPLPDGMSSPDQFEQRLKKCTNGYFLPRGQIIFSVLKDILLEDVKSLNTLKKISHQLSLVKPFPCTLIFQNIELMVTTELYNQFQTVTPKSGATGLDQVRAELKDWISKSGFSKKQIATATAGDFAKLAWLTTPHLEDPELILMYAKFLTFLSFHDDLGDNKEALGERDAAAKIREKNEQFKRIFKNDIPQEWRMSKDPLIRSAIELSEAIHTKVAEAVKRDLHLNLGFFHRTLDDYFDFTAQETEDILNEKILTLSSYAPKRLETSSLKVCFALSAILNGIPMSDTQLEKQKMKDLIDTGDLHVSYANDVISFPKEITSTSYSLTMIYLLEYAKAEKIVSIDAAFISTDDLKQIYQQDKGIIVQAIKLAVTTVNTTYFAYIQSKKSLSDSEDKKFADIIVQPWIPGNGIWQSEIDRYLNSSDFKGNITEYAGYLVTKKGFQHHKII